MTDSTEGWVREILYPISATDRLVEIVRAAHVLLNVTFSTPQGVNT